jgi:hypothetical protein
VCSDLRAAMPDARLPASRVRAQFGDAVNQALRGFPPSP